MRAIREFVAYSNIHIVLVAAGLILGTWSILGQNISWPILAVSCAGSFLIYLADRIWLCRGEDQINQPDRITWYRHHPQYGVIAAIVMGGTLMVNLTMLSIDVLLAGGALMGGASIYLLGESRTSFRLKGHWFFKPLCIAGAWVFGGVIFPVYASHQPIDMAVLGLALYRFPMIVANVLISDWPDREGDAAWGLQTLSVRLGTTHLRRLIVFFSVLSLLLGGAYAGYFEWTLLHYVDLLGPLLMMALAFLLTRISGEKLVFMADLIVAWPLATTLLLRFAAFSS